MEKIPRDPTRFEVLDLFEEFCRNEGYSIKQEGALQAFLERVKKNINEMVADDNRLRGLQGQAMFEAITIELGHTTFTKKEDAGRLYATSAVQPLDLRITLPNGRILLVEVKDTTADPWRGDAVLIQKKEFHRYHDYAKAAGGELRFAIFWRALWRWVLVPSTAFQKVKKHYALTFEESFRQNEMSILGDRLLATKTPLRLRIETDPSHPRELDEAGLGHYTIKNIDLFCRDTPIRDEEGRRLAFYMMLFGPWRNAAPRLQLDGRTILAVEWVFEPEAEEADPNCYMVDALSDMFARHFELVTRSGGPTLTHLSAEAVPGRLSSLAPSNFPFKSSGLPLWVFELQPKHD